MVEQDIDEAELRNTNSVHNAHNDLSQFSNPIPPAPSNKPSPFLWAGLGVLAIISLFVVFVLPTIVSEYELPLERRAENSVQSTPQVAATAATTISPFEEAQRARQRKDAQDVLGELLEQQRELENRKVSEWGQADYAAALEQAGTGDEYYRNQEFLLARDSYASARDSLIQILDSIPVMLSQTLIDAQKALEEGNSTLAQEKFALALVLDADSEAADVGIARARTLDEVSTLVKTADQLAEDGALEAASSNYQQALNLDSYNDYARQKIDEVARRITENEFARIMSAGYTLLESGEPEAAIAEFQRAAAVGINGEQAAAAITQAENDIANVEINRLRGLIAAAEADESWQQAVDEYAKVLAIDSNLVFAIEGRDYATKRAQLDLLLVGYITNPERLAEDPVFQETRDVYFTGRAIESPGPKLQEQLDQLEVFLESSQVPVDVQLVSDNLTEVTLLRVGSLGTFQQQTLSLKPGIYVAVGKRVGYREVREDFTVGFGKTPDSVVVSCNEPVATSSRR